VGNSKIKSVVKALKDEHKRIDVFLEDCVSHLKRNSNEVDRLFERFVWNLKKHFYMEEKTMFVECESDYIKDELEELKEDHEEILKVVERIEKKESKEIYLDFSFLKRILSKHAKREEDLLYEELERSLNQKQKEKVLEQSKELVK
jgi:hemerythrin